MCVCVCVHVGVCVCGMCAFVCVRVCARACVLAPVVCIMCVRFPSVGIHKIAIFSSFLHTFCGSKSCEHLTQHDFPAFLPATSSNRIHLATTVVHLTTTAFCNG